MALLAIFFSIATERGRAAQLAANYLDAAGEGFNDPSLGADRKAAFEYALGLWSAVLGDAYVGETVVVDAVFDPLGGTATSATLGSAGPRGSGFVSGDPMGFGNNVYFAGGLRNHLAGSDLSGVNEISSRFNSDVDGSTVLGMTTWYYGTDENGPSGTIDFVETALHEIGHGLGWSGSLDTSPTISDGMDPPEQIENPDYGEYLSGAIYNSYDHFVVRTSDGVALTSLTPVDRVAAITSDNISWSGALGVAANSGTAPDLYAPTAVAPGSTYAHLDEDDFTVELMSPFATAGTGHTLSPLTLAILQDQGWTISPIPEPSAGIFLVFGLVAGVFRRRR